MLIERAVPEISSGWGGLQMFFVQIGWDNLTTKSPGGGRPKKTLNVMFNKFVIKS